MEKEGGCCFEAASQKRECVWELKCSSGMFCTCCIEKMLHKEKSNRYINNKISSFLSFCFSLT